uniref:Chlamydophila pneumoniae plasmid DNA n=1 Tax=Chlamydia pneumoniae TaxID=83558 RepID=Q46271_CHLPN|nr:unnamed protein product [Chlamydia pneumoniae]
MSESEQPRRLYSVTAVALRTCGVTLKPMCANFPALENVLAICFNPTHLPFFVTNNKPFRWPK